MVHRKGSEVTDLVTELRSRAAAWKKAATTKEIRDTVTIYTVAADRIEELATISTEAYNAAAEKVEAAYKEWYERIEGGTGDLPVHMDDVESLIAEIRSMGK